MKSICKIFLTVAVLGSAMLGYADGEAVFKVNYPEFPDSKSIHGPKISAEELQGKVVFFEYWGINCGPCIASMPHLQELQNKYGNKGFTVVGSHCQGLNDSVKKFLTSKKITFPVYQQIRLKGADTKGGIPYAVLIAPGGKVIAKGYPGDLYKLVPKEVARLVKGFPILEGMKLEKYKDLEKSVLSKGVNVESKITPLRNKTNDSEAQEICRVFDDWLENTKRGIRSKLLSDPLGGIQAVTELKAAVPSVTEFDEELAALKANRDLPKLAVLQKKVNDLEEKKIKRGKVNEADVKSLVKELEGYVSSTDTATASVAAKLKESADALLPPAEE